MQIPADGSVPDLKERAEMISKSDNAGLEELRDYAWGRMASLSKAGKTAPPEYQEWSNFVGEITAEQHKRNLSEQRDSASK